MGAFAAIPGKGKTTGSVADGAGEPASIQRAEIEYHWAGWFPDGKRILIAGAAPNERERLYVQDLEGGKPSAVTPEGVGVSKVTTEGIGSGPGPFLRMANGLPLPALTTGSGYTRFWKAMRREAFLGCSRAKTPVCWDAGGRALFVFRRGALPAQIFRVDIMTGRRELVKEILPADPGGIYAIDPILPAPGGKSLVYGYQRTLSDLYLAEGLR